MVGGNVVDDLHAEDTGAALGLAARTQLGETARLLTDVAGFIRRYIVLTMPQTVAGTLWVLHTWTIDVADTSPYLWITSPEKRSGKTRLLEVLELVVREPWLTARTTSAALVRKISQQAPSLLLDETDSAFQSGDEYAETLRGVLNSGHRRGGVVSVCVGQGSAITVQDFSTFCPKALAGLSVLPDTVADRSIPIVLKRRKQTETVERFRRRDADLLATPLRERLVQWAEAMIPILAEARPEIPSGLNDRASESWEPLLAVADLGGEWTNAARQAAVTLHADQAAQEETTGVMLLAAIRQVFSDMKTDRLSTAALLGLLVERDDGPWSEWWGRQVTAGDVRGPGYKLGKLLKPFGISSSTVRFEDGKRLKGFELVDFADAFARYLPSPPQTT